GACRRERNLASPHRPGGLTGGGTNRELNPNLPEGPMLKDFRTFLLRGNVVDLAVAVVLGAAFGALVTALVADLITPIIAAIIGKPDFSNLTFTIHKSTFKYGDFINVV